MFQIGCPCAHFFFYHQYTANSTSYQSAQKIAPDFGKIKKQGRIMAPALKSATLHFWMFGRFSLIAFC
jgi:hypothetical protein